MSMQIGGYSSRIYADSTASFSRRLEASKEKPRVNTQGEVYRLEQEIKEENPNVIDNSKEYLGIHETKVDYVKKYLPDGQFVYDYADYWGQAALYTGYEGDADGNGRKADRYVFHANTNFLQEAAQKYAAIEPYQDFKYRPTKDGAFVKSAVDFFSHGNATEEDYAEMSASVDRIVRELAENIKAGKSTGIESLQNKLVILGEEISVQEFKDFQSASLKLVKSMGSPSFGTGGIETLAKDGITAAMAGVYGAKLPGKLGEEFHREFTSLVDDRVALRQRLSSSGISVQLDLDNQLGNEAYRLFSSLRFSTKEQAESGFQEALKQFQGILHSYNQSLHGLASIDQYMAGVQEQLQSLFRSVQ